MNAPKTPVWIIPQLNRWLVTGDSVMIEMLRRWKQGKGEVQHLVKHMGLRNTVSSFVNDLIPVFIYVLHSVTEDEVILAKV